MMKKVPIWYYVEKLLECDEASFFGMKMLLSSGETLDNYKNILHEYEDALVVRQKRIDDLYNEIKVVKKLKIRS